MPDHLPPLDDVVVIDAYLQEWRYFQNTSGLGGLNADARLTGTVAEEDEEDEEEDDN